MSITVDKAWYARFRDSMEEVERIKALELVGMTHQEAWRRMQNLQAPDVPEYPGSDWSGLIEQQAIFHRRKKP
jgi:hypothetical protein